MYIHKSMLISVKYARVYKLIHVLVTAMYVKNKTLFYIYNFYVLCIHIDSERRIPTSISVT